jgi:hypothetical protein
MWDELPRTYERLRFRAAADDEVFAKWWARPVLARATDRSTGRHATAKSCMSHVGSPAPSLVVLYPGVPLRHSQVLSSFSWSIVAVKRCSSARLPNPGQSSPPAPPAGKRRWSALLTVGDGPPAHEQDAGRRAAIRATQRKRPGQDTGKTAALKSGCHHAG